MLKNIKNIKTLNYKNIKLLNSIELNNIFNIKFYLHFFNNLNCLKFYKTNLLLILNDLVIVVIRDKKIILKYKLIIFKKKIFVFINKIIYIYNIKFIFSQTYLNSKLYNKYISKGVFFFNFLSNFNKKFSNKLYNLSLFIISQVIR